MGFTWHLLDSTFFCHSEHFTVGVVSQFEQTTPYFKCCYNVCVVMGMYLLGQICEKMPQKCVCGQGSKFSNQATSTRNTCVILALVDKIYTEYTK